MATVELVNLTVDGKKVSVPKGTNLIQAAKLAGVEVPYYCYHPHLSVVGNCRMCQVEVKGRPKLEIGCNTTVAEGMEVLTHATSKKVEDAQAATLEFILINHPLDCTVCDQAGHCKLQDYHYEYNARPSRFVEEKVHKVKAEELGPHVMLDGERCIMCTRCIRFCDEVTKTSELCMINRGDRSMIAIHPGKPLDNPLSGTVVDLCPVGALTHKDWRFNTRIWYTDRKETICPGCSTGCNVQVATRDNKVVHVKARLNPDVNKEWLCDEGRYGFERFVPEQRLTAPRVAGKESDWENAVREAAKLKGQETWVFLAPNLLLEDYWLIKKWLERDIKNAHIATAYRERKLSATEAILVSPDYAANFRGAEFVGLVSGNLELGYNDALQALRSGSAKNVMVIGDWGILSQDRDDKVLAALRNASCSVACVMDAGGMLADMAKVALPARSILEKSGMLINRKMRLQWSERLLEFPASSEPEWRIVNRLAGAMGQKLVPSVSDRDMSLELLRMEGKLQGLTIGAIKGAGVDLTNRSTGASPQISGAASQPAA